MRKILNNLSRILPYASFTIVIISFFFINLVNFAFSDTTGEIIGTQKISRTEGDFSELLGSSDFFGTAVAEIGDLDDDGVVDVAVGAIGDDDGGASFGAVYIIFLNSDGTVKDYQKISQTQGGFVGPITNTADSFGASVAGIGDLDGDNVEDIAVGEYFDDDGGLSRGAVWILFLNTDGTVKDEQKISDTAGGFTGVLANVDTFGECIAGVDDYNGDDISDLAVCASRDDDGGNSTGSIWILFLNTDGTVNGYQKISNLEGGLSLTISANERFGSSVTSVPDMNNDGVDEIAVGSSYYDVLDTATGAVYLLFMNDDGTVLEDVLISGETAGFTDALYGSDEFGGSVSSAGDLDGDGVSDLFVGATRDWYSPYNSEDYYDTGTYFILFMNSDGTVKDFTKLDRESDYIFFIDSGDRFASEDIAALSDLNGDGSVDLAVSWSGDDDSVTDAGAIGIIFFNVYNASGSGGRNYVFPRQLLVEINEGGACTATDEVALTLHALDANWVVVGNDPNFVGQDFEVFNGPEITKSWKLSPGAGDKYVYARFKSRTNELSGLQWARIKYDPINGCK